MNALTPIEQRTVVFYDGELTAVLADGTRGRAIYVPVRPICDFMGLNWDGQRRRINRDAILSQEIMSVVVTTTDIDPVSRRPHTSTPFACLSNTFLAGCSASTPTASSQNCATKSSAISVNVTMCFLTHSVTAV